MSSRVSSEYLVSGGKWRARRIEDGREEKREEMARRPTGVRLVAIYHIEFLHRFLCEKQEQAVHFCRGGWWLWAVQIITLDSGCFSMSHAHNSLDPIWNLQKIINCKLSVKNEYT